MKFSELFQTQQLGPSNFIFTFANAIVNATCLDEESCRQFISEAPLAPARQQQLLADVATGRRKLFNEAKIALTYHIAEKMLRLVEAYYPKERSISEIISAEHEDRQYFSRVGEIYDYHLAQDILQNFHYGKTRCTLQERDILGVDDFLASLPLIAAREQFILLPYLPYASSAHWCAVLQADERRALCVESGAQPISIFPWQRKRFIATPRQLFRANRRLDKRVPLFPDWIKNRFSSDKWVTDEQGWFNQLYGKNHIAEVRDFYMYFMTNFVNRHTVNRSFKWDYVKEDIKDETWNWRFLRQSIKTKRIRLTIFKGSKLSWQFIKNTVKNREISWRFMSDIKKDRAMIDELHITYSTSNLLRKMLLVEIHKTT